MRWRQRDTNDLKKQQAQLQHAKQAIDAAQQAAAEAQQELHIVKCALLAANQRERQLETELQAAANLHQGTTDCEALADAVCLVWVLTLYQHFHRVVM